MENKMNKALLASTILLSRAAFAQGAAEIKERYETSKAAAQSACGAISKQIDTIKLIAGISTVSSGIGTLAAGTALVTGLVKSSTDKKIRKLEDMDDYELYQYALELEKEHKTLDEEKEKLKKKSGALGAARTVGSFVAGGTSAVAAATSFAGAISVDYNKLKRDMRDCEKHAANIRGQRNELIDIAPSDPLISEMAGIYDKCRGFDTGNIDTIKTTLTIGGIVSTVGAGTGIAGGIVSHKAGRLEKAGASATKSNKQGGTAGYNKAANILAGVTAATSAGSALLTGLPLIALAKNAKIAGECRAALN
jgi:hypothetical protein